MSDLKRQHAPHASVSPVRLPWIEVAAGAPYFQTEDGEPWHPIGYNDAISWVDLNGLFRRRDLPGVDRYLADLAAQGTTVIRVMLEYAQVKHRQFERPAGVFVPAMTRLWDDFFAMAERHGLRFLITPFDTFWTWLRWEWHPYNRAHGGPLASPSEFLLCGETRKAIKARLEFVVRRWGGSGAFFAWDLWNEIHPAQARDTADCFPEFIADLSAHVRGLERDLYGRSHPQTVSLFGPELEWRGHLPMTDPLFRHPDLDFATIHVYQKGTIDDPRNTVDPARDMARHVRSHLGEIADMRPYLDTEHGPIHLFKDKKKTLKEDFDDEYFRHIQWAHLAAGGAGGGMRWPNRRPHRLTQGMRRAQAALSRFMPELDWLSFRRSAIDPVVTSAAKVHAIGCGDDRQALVYLLRADALNKRGMVDRSAPPVSATLSIPGLRFGRYRATVWDTVEGRPLAHREGGCGQGALTLALPPFAADLAIAVKPLRA
jgi:hypothetical protein